MNYLDSSDLSVTGAGVPHVDTDGLHLGLDRDVSCVGVNSPAKPGDVGSLHQPDGALRPLLHSGGHQEGVGPLQSLLGLQHLVNVCVDTWQQLFTENVQLNRLKLSKK